ncbi:MAG: glycogen debranching protein GlgX [Sandaracinaceae bacterium]
MNKLRTRPGQPYPMGATWDGLGVNFAVYSAHAERIELLLFDDPDAAAPSRRIEMTERTGPVWHVHIIGLRPRQLYAYAVHGPFDPADGARFNPHKVLLDPYAKAIGRPLRWHDALFGYEIGSGHDADLTFSTTDAGPHAPLGMVVEPGFHWGDDRPPLVPWERTVIYETHVKGLTRAHPEVPEELRGTYLGLTCEPVLSHLVSLGITTVQLMPLQAFVHDRHLIDRGLHNYWGYNPLAYFAPEPTYAAGGPAQAVNEVKMMVRALHAAGLEVILDVVYNHTGEGSHLGPTLSYRGIDNQSYYKLAPVPRYYMDYTGTGNTFDASNPYVLQLVMDSLRYWVREMHVDGFRFDLAAALARELYEVDMLSAFFKVIQQDPELSQVKLIAEPWDGGPGGYQVGAFPWQWTEWNGSYRDSIRGFWRGDRGIIAEVATRLSGSSDLYERSGRRPFASVNFVCAHDGFTLKDLVSYQHKHNEANGENNQDGHDDNRSTNGGVEGPTEDVEILNRRDRRRRALAATLMLSQGVPMWLGGDEIGRTQQGNNNAYCQDNEISWYDWRLSRRDLAFQSFMQQLVAFRLLHPTFCRRRFLSGDGDVSWWHPSGREMTEEDWHDADAQTLGMLLYGDRLDEKDRQGRTLRDDTFLIILHAGGEMQDLALPPLTRGRWRLEWSTVSGAVKTPEGVRVPPESVVVLARSPALRQPRRGVVRG